MANDKCRSRYVVLISLKYEISAALIIEKIAVAQELFSLRSFVCARFPIHQLCMYLNGSITYYIQDSHYIYILPICPIICCV